MPLEARIGQIDGDLGQLLQQMDQTHVSKPPRMVDFRALPADGREIGGTTCRLLIQVRQMSTQLRVSVAMVIHRFYL